MAAPSNHSHPIMPAGALPRRHRPARGLIYNCLIISAILWATLSSAWSAPPLLFPEKTARIALDPGHGGKDAGAKGPTGLLEKDVCLEVARKLAIKLETLYQVTLTRSDDYQVDLNLRAAIANQADADILISLHTGAGFVHSARGMAIYYYASDHQAGPSGGGDKPQRWEQTQTRHQPASLRLAAALKKSLDQLDPESPHSSVHGAPLALLEGADMPAVLLETGHITSPATETKLADPKYQERLVDEILKGVQAFLSEQAASRTQ